MPVTNIFPNMFLARYGKTTVDLATDYIDAERLSGQCVKPNIRDWEKALERAAAEIGGDKESGNE